MNGAKVLELFLLNFRIYCSFARVDPSFEFKCDQWVWRIFQLA